MKENIISKNTMWWYQHALEEKKNFKNVNEMFHGYEIELQTDWTEKNARLKDYEKEEC